MAERKLGHIRVAILATQGFEQAELIEPRKALDEAGAQTVVVAPKPGKIRGVKRGGGGESVDVDLTLDQADPNGFDALLLPGGALNADAHGSDKAQPYAPWIGKLIIACPPLGFWYQQGWRRAAL